VLQTHAAAGSRVLQRLRVPPSECVLTPGKKEKKEIKESKERKKESKERQDKKERKTIQDKKVRT
jgi:hypothetical protein